MIWITGDTHGDFRRFATSRFPQQKQMSRDDYAIITGDYGGIWGGSPREAYWLNWLEESRLPPSLWTETMRISTGSTSSPSITGMAEMFTSSALM